MLGYIWAGIMIFSVISALFTGRMPHLTTAAINGAQDALALIISLSGVICLWSGLMAIAQKGGVLRGLTRLLRPVNRLLFPDVVQNERVMAAITANIAANLMGMSNAATPLGLNAMKELDRLNAGSRRASNSMCMLVVVNSCSLQIIPATLIALRFGAGSAAPADIMVPVWITSFAAVLAGVVAAKLLERHS